MAQVNKLDAPAFTEAGSNGRRVVNAPLVAAFHDIRGGVGPGVYELALCRFREGERGAVGDKGGVGGVGQCLHQALPAVAEAQTPACWGG